MEWVVAGERFWGSDGHHILVDFRDGVRVARPRRGLCTENLVQGGSAVTANLGSSRRMSQLRADMKGELGALRGELQELRGELARMATRAARASKASYSKEKTDAHIHLLGRTGPSARDLQGPAPTFPSARNDRPAVGSRNPAF
jgi:hypothetical protein